MIIGIDIGVRGFAMVGLHKDSDECFTRVMTVERERQQIELKRIRDSIDSVVMYTDRVFVEEPPLAGPKNIRTAFQLNQVAGVILSASQGDAYLVPVASWKKAVCGQSNADKAFVARWLEEHHPELHRACGVDQNLMDAACLALYGREIDAIVRDSAVSAGSVDLPL